MHTTLYATSLEALLSLQNSEFIYCCYQTLLDRDVSPAELDKHLGVIQQGTPQMELILELLESSEARDKSTVLPGLKQGITQHRYSRIPVIGWILRYYFKITRSKHVNQYDHRIIRLTPWGQEVLRRIDLESSKYIVNGGGL